MNTRNWIVVIVFLVFLIFSAGSIFLYTRYRSDGATAVSIQTIALGPNLVSLIPPPPLPPAPSAPPPILDPGIFDPYGKNNILSIGIGDLIAKRTSNGIIVRDYQDPDEKGVFTPIPNAKDFHRLDASDGSRSPYYQAGDSIYVFTYDITSQNSFLPSLKRVTNAVNFAFIPGLTTRMAKDSTHVYIDGIPDSVINVKTLSTIPDHPSVFQDALYVYSISGGLQFYTITPFTPPLSFLSQPPQEPWGEFRGYVADKNAVYFQSKKITDADLNTFAVFTTPKLHQLKESGVIYSYAKDKNRVYYEGVVVPGADPSTFSPLTNGGAFSYYYGKDANAVYEGSTIIPGLDPNTVQILWESIYEGCGLTEYIKDATRVFYLGKIVPNADPETFTSLIRGYGRDKNGIWYGTQFRTDLPKDFEPDCNYG